MSIKEKLTPKRLLNSIVTGIVAAGLAAVISIMIILGFHLPIQYVTPIIIVFTITFSVIFTIKPEWPLKTVGALMFLLGILLIFLSGNEEISKQITWNPSMLGAGVSTVALGVMLFTVLNERKSKVETATQPVPVSQRTPRPLETKTIGYAFLLIMILSLASNIKKFVERECRSNKEDDV